ncbi:hypothetical protein GCG54_00011573 [Colletotrichum gloeosporioides]|uniref:Uncharacterized protein n=1 Tax=Colletotrichum gloeosporioides TaxID=474922 RepID=A0A8H4FQE6_COLGL|nr:uncharacterized protein GCG54_00011573 [Colletotrichum gloeosporioides]KAF3809374.1 hypothetical protein GCG54_00011573 [Colletotrichum gloeosporioides]
MLRSGSFGPRFSKVVAVRHSIGGKATETVMSKYPSDFVAIMHTGYAYENAAGAGSVVATGFGSPWGVNRLQHLPDGYLVPKSAEGIHICFFKYPNFNPQILVILGEHDYVVCGQSCVTPQNLAAQTLDTAYASANQNLSEAWISPGADYICHAHLNAPAVSAGMVNSVKNLGWNT